MLDVLLRYHREESRDVHKTQRLVKNLVCDRNSGRASTSQFQLERTFALFWAPESVLRPVPCTFLTEQFRERSR